MRYIGNRERRGFLAFRPLRREGSDNADRKVEPATETATVTATDTETPAETGFAERLDMPVARNRTCV